MLGADLFAPSSFLVLPLSSPPVSSWLRHSPFAARGRPSQVEEGEEQEVDGPRSLTNTRQPNVPNSTMNDKSVPLHLHDLLQRTKLSQVGFRTLGDIQRRPTASSPEHEAKSDCQYAEPSWPPRQARLPSSLSSPKAISLARVRSRQSEPQSSSRGT